MRLSNCRAGILKAAVTAHFQKWEGRIHELSIADDYLDADACVFRIPIVGL